MAKEKNNKKCIICGTVYSYCPVCGEDKNKPSWYMIFDSDNCNNIYDIVTGYRDAKYTIKEANELLKNCDLSKIDSEDFNETTRKQIKEILEINEIDSKAVDALIGKNAEKVVPVAEEIVEIEESQKSNDYNGSKRNGYNKHFNKK